MRIRWRPGTIPNSKGKGEDGDPDHPQKSPLPSKNPSYSLKGKSVYMPNAIGKITALSDELKLCRNL